ncbi:hypothetical protein CHUAL_004701 [Chamberlinius hualienensis]
MMADGEALINVSDSRSVSSPLDECSSPLGESPHKLISDCSDLYDLINFHSSATTQISHHDDDDDDNIHEELHHDDEPEVDEAISSSKTNVSISNSESHVIIYKKRSRSSSSSSSGSDHDSDSGHFSKANGHAEPEIEIHAVLQSEYQETLEVIDVPESNCGNVVAADENEHERDAEISIQEQDAEESEHEQDSEVSVHKQDAEISVHEPDAEESEHEEEELDEFSQLEAEIEKNELHIELQEEVSDVVVEVESVVAPELHDINPAPTECVLSQRESSLVKEELQHHELETNRVSDSAVDISHDDVPVQDAIEVKVEEAESSSSEEEEAQDEGCVSDELDGDGCHETERALPPVIVDVEISQPKLVSSDVSILDTDLDKEFVETIETTIVQTEEKYVDDIKVHAISSSSSDSESDHGGKYGYMKKKTVDQMEKSMTTSKSAGAVVTTVVTKKSTAEMKLEHTGSPKAIEYENGNSTVKSSFNATESESRYKEFSETEGVKIDRNKITRNFSQTNVGDDKLPICRICGKQVFHMESIKAEKNLFHKSCFRCKECNKPLSVDTYCSHEGVLYCRQHFRQLFQPKAKFEEEVIVIPRRRHELIIKENTPQELPPDVVRSADKPDYGLNEIPSLKNVKSRFEDREHENGNDSTPTVVHVKRSESIASKMARFQNKESSENGHHVDDSSSSGSSDEEDIERDVSIVKESKHKKETVVFSGMSQLKNQWENGSPMTKEERAREKQEELAKLRLRICHGKGSLKAKYESACEESLKSPGRQLGENVDLNGEIHTSSLKEKFEKGKVENELELEKVEKILREKEEDLSVFKDQGTSNDARNLFKQMDATVSKTGTSPVTPNNLKRSPSAVNRDLANDRSPNNGEVIKCSDKIEEDCYASVDLSSRFKFFENYRDEHDGAVEKKRFTMTPPREILKDETPERDVARDPNIVRSCDREEEVVVTDTARKMLSKFRELESQTEDVPAGPKPLKRITPPREFTKDNESPEPEIFRDPTIVRSCDKVEDDFLMEARKAKNLREKFERWEIETEVERENRRNVEEDYQPAPEMAKSLTAKFEALRDESSRPSDKPQAKVNRFI